MKLFQKNELKLLWPFYLEYLISSTLYIAPVFFTVYFLEIGFSIFQVALVLAASQIAMLLFEIPTGSFADLYGRKLSVIVGYAIEGICMISLFFAKSFYPAFILFILWGIGATFSSGSKDAWIVDEINKKNKHLVHSFFNKQQIIINIGLFLSGIFGALIVKFLGISTIWLFTASSYVCSIALLAAFAKEDYSIKKIKPSESFKDLKNQAKISINYSRKHPVLFYFMIAGIIFAFASMLQIDISWIPLLKELGMKDYAFGYLWSAFSLLTAASAIFGMKMIKKGKERNFIVLMIFLGAIINLLVLVSYKVAFAVIILCTSLFFFRSKNPGQNVYFHRFLPSKLRSTVGSIQNMTLALTGAIALPLAGWLVQAIGPRYTILLSSALMIPAVIIYWRIKDNGMKK